MNVENLWGEIVDPAGQRTPASILREQASILNQITKGLLVGVVEQLPHATLLIFGLDIRAPGLNNYKITIATIQHPITLYPLIFMDRIQGVQSQCSSEEDFVARLKSVLISAPVKKVISALLVQSKEVKAG